VISAGLDIQAAEGSFYGFALAEALAGADGGRALTSHGTLYKALSRMTEAGLLDSTWESPERAEGAGRPRRRLYTVTGAGARALAQRSAQVESAASTSRTSLA
jgi:DNA-binding PadR family transcriptional regulator